jgi:hypothetical protein
MPCILEANKSSKGYRKNRARLIQKIYEVYPLTCPKCQKKNSSTFSVRIPLSSGTCYAQKDSVFCYDWKELRDPKTFQYYNNTEKKLDR